MVFVALTNGVNADLYTFANQYGNNDDFVYGVYQSGSPGYTYTVNTYRGNDIIELRDLQANSNASILAGAGNDTIYGCVNRDNFYDQSGNDIAFLGAGSDAYYLGRGNDTVDGGSGIDVLSFHDIFDDIGTNSIQTSAVTVDLQLTTIQNFGILGLDVIKNFENVEGGYGNDRIYGSSVANQVFGSIGNDYLDGRAGNDWLFGGFGNDTLLGGVGNDRLFGETESDTLVGGSGGDELTLAEGALVRDHVRYYKINESSATSTAQYSADWIFDFDKGGSATDDKIDFSRIDARASTTTTNETFVWRGVTTAAVSASTAFGTSTSGEIRIAVSGADSIVYLDNDADRAAEMIIVVKNVTGLTSADFIL